MNDTLPIIGVAKLFVVEDVNVPWDFVSQHCSHQLLRQLVPGRYACEVCTAELVLRPLRHR